MTEALGVSTIRLWFTPISSSCWISAFSATAPIRYPSRSSGLAITIPRSGRAKRTGVRGVIGPAHLNEVSRSGSRAMAKIIVLFPVRAAVYPSDQGTTFTCSRDRSSPIPAVINARRSTEIPCRVPFST
ncbi:MAG: hypothetical protein BWY93_02240 [Euryarchaeota archaeon ADurb.BinA087]|nr:MAG: hypothetical protein BWY93_02240 [Euryarchaeota archaeon ADurb.BinA087]